MNPVKQHNRAWLATLGHSVHSTELQHAAFAAITFFIATWMLFPALDGGADAFRIGLGVAALSASAFMLYMQHTSNKRARLRLRTARRARFPKEAV